MVDGGDFCVDDDVESKLVMREEEEFEVVSVLFPHRFFRGGGPHRVFSRFRLRFFPVMDV